MPPEMQDQKVEILEAQKSLLLLCENKEIDKATQIELLKKASPLFSGTELQSDLNGLITSLSSERGRVDQTKYTVCDTDDPCDILLMGHEISNSCQRLDGNRDLNIGLLGPLLDGKYRIIAIKDENNKLVARCLLKVLWDSVANKPVLFQERIYVYNQPHNAAYHSELLNEMCKKKAQDMGLSLLSSDAPGKGYPNSVESLGGRSSFEYVDALRGINGNTYSISNSTVIWQPET